MSYWDEVVRGWCEASPQRLWRAHSDATNVALLTSWLPAGRSKRLLKTDLFDEAAGPGLYPLLASRAECVIGVDVSTMAVKAARRRHPGLDAVCTDVRQLPFAEGLFDVVVSNSTLDHFETLAEADVALQELRRVVRDGGEILLTLDNGANPIIALRNALPSRLVSRLGLVPYYVGATCGPKRLRHLLTQGGWNVLEVTAQLHSPRVLAVPVAALLERYGSENIQARYLRVLMAFERLARWPVRFLTGHYIAVRAQKV